MNRQTAGELIDAERELRPAVVVLARHLSIAVRIETELIRAMRLRVMPGEEAGVESDLFFSRLVQTRDISAITLIPEVRSRLHDELAHRQAELDLAHEVIAAAHRGMDAVIPLEEAVVYYSLRGDWKAYRRMQIELGTLVQALTKDSVDPDLIRWTAGAFPRFTDRARRSRAGQTLMRTLDRRLDLLRGGSTPSDLPTAEGLPSTVTIGFRAVPNGIQLSVPPATGWLALEMPGPLPLRIDVGWPVPGGWKTDLVEVRDQQDPVALSDVPFGMVRLRGTDGDEIKLRADGPFHQLRPRLLGLSHDPGADPGDMIDAELADLAWQAHWNSLWVGARPLVLVVHAAASGAEEKVVDVLYDELRTAGFKPWMDRRSRKSGDDWSAERMRVIAGCHAVVVVLSDASMHSRWVADDLSRVAQRKQNEASLPVHVLLAPGVDPQSVGTMLTGESAWLQSIHWKENPADIVAALARAWFEDRAEAPATAGLLVFNDIKSLLQYRRELDLLDWDDERLMPALDALVDAGCPIMARVGDRIRRLAYPAGPVMKTDPGNPAAWHFRQLTDALDRLVDSATGEMAAAGDARRIFREGLLDGERRAVSAWLSRLADGQRARTPSDPPHAMVLIKWESWFPKGADAPRHFDTYRSRQARLVRLMGNGGTLWVVTSRTDADGNRRYQLAYRLDDVEMANRPMPAETKASIARDYVLRAPTEAQVLQFPLHDATETLLQLTFTTGRPLAAPGDIGRRLQSIPQLSVADVDRLNAFAAQFTDAAGDGAVRLRCRFRGDAPEGHRGTVRSIVFRADGKMALTAGNSHPDQCVKYWDLDRGVLVHTFEDQALPGGRTPMAISSDGNFAAVGYEGRLRVLDLGSGEKVHELRVAEEEISAVAFFDDTGVLAGTAKGHLLAVDLKSGQIYWDRPAVVAAGAVLRISIDEGEALVLGASGMVHVLVDGSPSEIRIAWRLDATAGEPALFMQGPPLAMDRKHGIALFGNPLQFLNLRENRVQQTIETEWPVAEAINGRVVTTDGESAFRVLDAPYTQPLDAVRIAPERAACAALSADGRRLVIADYEHNLHVYDLPPLTVIEDVPSPKDFREYEWTDYYDRFTYFAHDSIRDDCFPLKMEQASSGKAIVLVHGLTDSPYFMRAIAAFFFDTLGYNVYVPLLHGHGLKTPDRMDGVELAEWKANVAFAIKTAAADAGQVSIGGLSTGGALSFFMAATNPAINGTLYLFSAALDLAGGRLGLIGEIKERLLRTFLADLLDSNKPLIGENPYRYSHVAMDGARELARLIKETDTLMDGYSETHPFQKKVFAVHSEADTTADIAGIEKLQRLSVPPHFHFFRIPKTENVRHASVVLKTPIAAGTKILEAENPQFDRMMAAIADFEASD